MCPHFAKGCIVALADLRQSLSEQPWLRAAYNRLVRRSVATQLSLTSRHVANDGEPPDWCQLLLAASVLARSDQGRHQEVALRIVQECLVDSEVRPDERDAGMLILDTLANRRAITLYGEGTAASGIEERLGIVARLQWTRHTFENSVDSAGQLIAVNHFQRRFWEAANSFDWVSASAPTSAGKSFIVLRHVLETVRSEPDGVVAYIAPTRALVHEIEIALKVMFREARLPARVTAIPLRTVVSPGVAHVLVFTQERLQLFLDRQSPCPRVRLLVIDEAQKMGDRHRGVLLQQVIERVVSLNPGTKVIFASPQTDNPGLLLDDRPPGTSATPLRSEEVTVNQNLVWATQSPGNTTRWEISACLPDGREPVGIAELPDRPLNDTKRLAFVAFALGKAATGNLVYVNRPSDAEKVAELLFELIGREAGETAEARDVELRDLAELARHAVHPRFLLARYASRGIAFHYGNMPLLLRSEVERLFSTGALRFLICTSTLIEGVNLACRNVFVRGPRKGPEPMSDGDFWNLAGRAGRWGRDRVGNIICIDATNPAVWHGRTAPFERQQQTIKRAADGAITTSERLVDYIRRGTPRSESRRESTLEYTAAYLMGLSLSGVDMSQMRWVSRFEPAVIASVTDAVSNALRGIQVDQSVVRRNPGISPLAMQALLNEFRRPGRNVEDYLPTLPESDNAVGNYMAVFDRIGRTLSPVFRGRQLYSYVLLTVDWMRGYPLPRIIDRRRAYFDRVQRPYSLAALIRRVMEDVETVARFEAPKFLGCYLDVLRQHLSEVGRTDLVDQGADLGVLLEFGVSSTTELSLMSLGLSRTSAVALAQYMPETSRNESECLAWLAARDLEELDLPAAVRREAQQALSLHIG